MYGIVGSTPGILVGKEVNYQQCQELGQPGSEDPEGFTHLIFYRFYGNAESRANFPIAQPFESAQLKNGSALLGQIVNCGPQPLLQFVQLYPEVAGIGPVFHESV